MLTQERADLLTKILSADINSAQELLAKEPEEALVEINNSGNDFTIEELKEYCLAFKNSVIQEGELTEESLDEVSGGVVVTVGLVCGLGACFAGGVAIGVAACAKW